MLERLKKFDPIQFEIFVLMIHGKWSISRAKWWVGEVKFSMGKRCISKALIKLN